MKRRKDPLATFNLAGQSAPPPGVTWLPLATVGLLALASILFVLSVNRQWGHELRSSVEAVDGLSRARIYATQASVLAEKMLSGSTDVSPAAVNTSLLHAISAFADCRRAAGQTSPGRTTSDEIALRRAVAAVEQALHQASAATASFPLIPANAAPEERNQLGESLRTLDNASADLDEHLDKALADRLTSQSGLLAVMTILWIAFCIGMIAIVWASLRHRHKSEQQIHSGLELLRTIVECAQVAIIVLDRKGLVRMWNVFAEDLFGWDHKTIYGRELPIIPEELRNHHEAVFERALRGETLAGTEVQRRKADGTLVDLNLYIAPIRGENDEVAGVVGVLADISQRKRQESELRETQQRYQQVVEHSPLGIFIQTAGVFRYLNPSAAKMLGADSQDQLIGTPVMERFHPDWRPVVAERIRRLTEENEPASVLEQIWLRLDGTEFHVEVSGVPFRDAQGTGALVFFTDISGVRLAQEEKRRMEEQFHQAQKMESIGRLAGGVAHDFNNLLTIINGYSNLLLGDLAEDDPHREQLSEVAQAGERAAGLTRQLLAFSRKQVIQPTLLSLNEAVRETERMLGRLIGEDIELVVRLEDGLLPVLADPGQVHQVLLNLAVNARDAMPTGGRLTIATRNVELLAKDVVGLAELNPGPHVELTITDSGLGMTDEVLTHLFEPFFTTKDRGSGTGLGLSTVYGIVKQSGGAITARSTPGRGSTFRILLPASSGHSASGAAEPRSEAAHQGNETILVTEDNAEVRKLACGILRRNGYRVLDAADAASALVLARSYRTAIDLLVTDVVLPGGATGKELSRYLRTIHPETGCLFMSGYTADVIGERGELPPGTNYLQKPFTPASLCEKVRAALDRSRRPSDQ